ncbi:MAG TPA: NAD-dependent epimerase/dehydratase family protein [Nitrososphaeraceae archaeon]|nr:NAD-dependent epimerase/dehydratase family protein [Nitrososphaeraceae archaeon]
MTIKKVLVTGSKGFVGRHLSARLKEVGLQVVTTDKNRKHIDVTNVDQIPTIENVNAIVHLAAKTSVLDSFKEPHKIFFTNVMGTLNVLEFARIRNIKKLIYVSTYVYGEPRYLPIDEKHVVNPHSPYNTSKLIAEKICQNYSQHFNMNIVTLRPFYVYGPDSRYRSLIPSMISQIKKDGKVKLSGKKIKRDFLFVSDFVDLIEKILQDFPKGYNFYNVGYGRSYSLNQVSDSLARLLGKKIKIQISKSTIPEISDMRADITKVSKAFNWTPTIDMRKGLRLIVEDLSD